MTFMPFYSLNKLPEREILKGVKLRSVYLSNTMLTFFELEPFAVIPRHKHENEQITYVLEGELEFVLGSEKRIVRQGDIIAIPSNVEHEAKALDKGAKAIDCWYPIRDDYK